MTAASVDVLMVEDHPVFRRGLRQVLSQQDWIGTVFEAATGAEAVRIATEHPVGVVALDLGLPDADGIDVARQLRRIRPDAPILVLTMVDDDHVVAAALRSGARGYLLKEQDPDDIVAALRTVAGGGLVLGARITCTVVDAFGASRAMLPVPLNTVTDRERLLLGHLAGGRGNAHIARALGLSEKTVRNQMSALFQKIGVGDRVAAALLARDAGLEA